MRITILKAEYKRLYEILRHLRINCPVCIAARKLTPRYKANTGCLHFYGTETPCHPSIQKRCRKFVYLEEDFSAELMKMFDEVESALIDLIGWQKTMNLV